MALAASDRLGPYEIVLRIGKGGMGEVWRARDQRLNREVAIKVSAQQFTDRFEREARAIAALNHPNICTLYDVGPNYLVMELIEGPTLADRIAQGPIPLEETLAIAKQITDALDAAQEKGIVHRDLKPANIKIRPDGSIKVLDFGLAKSPEPSEVTADSPTMSVVGLILGTAGYMAPEQARGKPVDKRADIWAFGVVLYEMVTGQRLFEGETVSDTLAAVIKEEPDFAKVPARLQRLLRACLEKDPKRRLRDIGDAQRLLEDTGPAATSHGKLPWIAAAVVFALIAAGLALMHFRETPLSPQTLRYTIAAPEGSTVHSFAISPDGRTLVMAAAVNGKRQLWLRAMNALQAQPMPFTEDATYPFWSPDSRYIGFFAQGKLKKVAASGGPPQSLCDAPNSRGGSWGRDDVIVFAPSNIVGPIQRVPAGVGVPTDVTKPGTVQRHPVFFPDGRHFLYFMLGTTAESNGIYVSSLDGKENRKVLSDVSSAIFAPPSGGNRAGHILFVRENTLMALPFDAAGAKAMGDVFPVAESVSTTTNYAYLPGSVSDNGVLLYVTGGPGGSNQIGWFDRSGKSPGPIGAPGGALLPALSPDEKLIAYRRDSGTRSDLWIRHLSRGTEARFTSDGSINSLPFWSPDGEHIVFTSNRKGAFNLYEKAASGSGKEELLLPNSVSDFPTQWSRDGRFIVYREDDPKNKSGLWVLPAQGGAADRKPIPFLGTESNDTQGQLSPDSRWMAFASDRSGRYEVYVRPFPAGEGEWPISSGGGQYPRWRADGRELFFVGADGKMMAVPVKAATGAKPSFEPGIPAALFDAHMAPGGSGFEYDVTADGKRFLINSPSAPAASSSPQLSVVTNWNAGSKR